MKRPDQTQDIIFGSLSGRFDPSQRKLIFGSPMNKDLVCESSDPNLVPDSPPISNSKLLDRSLVCFHCLELGHFKWQCKSNIRCARCLDLGHMQRFCKAQSPVKYKLEWRPKAIVTQSSPKINWRPVKPVGNSCSKSQVHPIIDYALETFSNAPSAPIPIFNETSSNKSSTILDSVPDPPHPSRKGKPQPACTSSPSPSANPTVHQVPLKPTTSHLPHVNVGSMANYPVNPQAFLISGLTVNHGWNRPARGRMVLGGEPTREHEYFAIVSLEPMPKHVHQLWPRLNTVCNWIEHHQRVRIESAFLSPLGLGLIKLQTVAQRDQLVRNSPYHTGDNFNIQVVKHDEGITHRACTYTRICWIMFLAFPLDFQKEVYIRAAVAPYGRLLDWYRDTNKTRVLVQCLLLHPDRVPHSLVVSRGTTIGGAGRSWSVPVYILEGEFPNAFPADEDPVPFDGEPHPEHPPCHGSESSASQLGI